MRIWFNHFHNLIFTILGKYLKLTHAGHKCEYHIEWALKYRILKDALSSFLHWDVNHLSSIKDVLVEELNIQSDHIHLLCSIPPKLSVLTYMSFLKGKTAIKVLKKAILIYGRGCIRGIIFGQEDILSVQ